MTRRIRTSVQTVLRLIIFIIIWLLIFFYCLPRVSSEEKKDSQDVTVTVTREEMPADKIYYGSFAERITNPRCLDLVALLEKTPEFQQIKKNEIEKDSAKYWILLSRASDKVYKEIDDYTADAEIQFLCDRSALFKVLRKMPQFETADDETLIAEFDVTAKIIEFNGKEISRIRAGEHFNIREHLGSPTPDNK